MDLTGFLKAVANINSSWTLAAFAIAAALGVLNVTSNRKRGAPTNSIIWGVVVIICVLGLAPTIAQAYLKRLEIVGAVYRVRVLVVDSQHVPVSGATIRTTASNETTTTDQGIAQVSIPRATMPTDGKVTIFADLGLTFSHGHKDIQLGDDPNPSVTIEIAPNTNAEVSGLVEDKTGNAVSGATVSVLGGGYALTSSDGRFTVKTNSSVGQQVRLHVEKVGYQPVDQDHPAGSEPATIVITRTKQGARKSNK